MYVRYRNKMRAVFGRGDQIPAQDNLGREGASWFRQLLLIVALGYLAVLLLRVVGGLGTWVTHRTEILLALTGIACWRWGWFILQNVRALVYRYRAYPRLQREAQEAIAKFGPVPEVTVLATTYKEKPWITTAVFESVFSELDSIRGVTKTPRVIVVTGCDEDDANIRQIFDKFYPAGTPGAPELVLMRGANGKRPALAAGMEEIARGNPDKDGAIVIMDADSMFQPGALSKSLPLFRLKPDVAAVTTNESGVVKGPAWFAEWISLRFGLRHRTMCSISLSGKLLCLTGRLSIFRAAVVVDPTFRRQVEKDLIEHWLWGEFEMLSGDDKSTWYWLAKNEHRMLYVPDAMVTTIEVVTGSAVRRALANVRRWSGNSLRHSWRAIKLGPGKLGLFPWWSLVDQRLAMWTVLFGPTVAILSIIAGRYELAAGYLLWVMLSRVAHASIAWRHGRRISAYYIPLQILSDWMVALLKVWVLFHPAKQNWLNRGARTLDTTRDGAFFAARKGMAHYLWGFSCAMLILAIGIVVGLLPLLRDARLFLDKPPVVTAGGQATGAITPKKSELLLGMTLVKPLPGPYQAPLTFIPQSWTAVQPGTDGKEKTPKVLEAQPHE